MNYIDLSSKSLQILTHFAMLQVPTARICKQNRSRVLPMQKQPEHSELTELIAQTKIHAQSYLENKIEVP